MRYPLPLIANVPTVVRFRGRNFTMMRIDGAPEIDLKLNTSSQQDEEDFGAVGRNFTIFSPDVDFTGATLTSPVNATVEFIVTNFRIETIDGTTLTATIAAGSLPLPVTVSGPDPLPVQNDRGGAPGTPVYVTGLTYTDTPAASIVDKAAVAVNDAGQALLAADASRLEARFTNIGTDAVALGTTGITWAARAIILQPGDTWIEAKAAALVWRGITDAGDSASVTIQELLA